jgi:hypothetical protein
MLFCYGSNRMTGSHVLLLYNLVLLWRAKICDRKETTVQHFTASLQLIIHCWPYTLSLSLCSSFFLNSFFFFFWNNMFFSIRNIYLYKAIFLSFRQSLCQIMQLPDSVVVSLCIMFQEKGVSYCGWCAVYYNHIRAFLKVNQLFTRLAITADAQNVSLLL